jgi:hypothetical protein
VPTAFPDGEQPKDLVKSGRVPTDDIGAEFAGKSSSSTPKSEKRKSGLRHSRSEGEPGVISTTSTRASTSEKGKGKAPADAAPASAPALAATPAAAEPSADEEDDTTIIAAKPSLKQRLSSALSRDTNDDDNFQEARDQFDDPNSEGALATPEAESKGTHSPAPGSKFAEDL